MTPEQVDDIINVITALTALVAAIGAAYAGYVTKKNAEQIGEAKVQQRRQERKVDDLTETLDANTTVTQATHSLVNSDYGIALAAAANALRHVVLLTKNPADKELAEHEAERAEERLEDHNATQAEVDSKLGPVPGVPNGST